MKSSHRREWIKEMATGVAALSSGAVLLPAFQEEKRARVRPAKGDFWKRVDEIKARNLVESATKAARAEVESQRATNASKRAAILLGGDAGKEHALRAATHYQTRTAELQNTKQALALFVRDSKDSGDKRFAEFASKGGLKELTAHARRSSIQLMLNSEISPEEAQAAVKALDDRLAKIQQMNSFHDVTSFLDQHLDELIARKMPQEDPNGFCVLILIISSIFAVLVVIAALICIFSFGLACQGILDQLIAQACP